MSECTREKTRETGRTRESTQASVCLWKQEREGEGVCVCVCVRESSVICGVAGIVYRFVQVVAVSMWVGVAVSMWEGLQ